jgi:hypothetical protein
MKRLVGVTAGLGLVLLLGCGHDTVGPHGDLVGGECISDRDCQATCLTGSSHYPGGMCTVPCNNDLDCPPDTACVDDSGGVCAVSCLDYRDCDGFGGVFTCNSVGRKGTGGDTLVCRVD